jgi:hypothetical protein
MNHQVHVDDEAALAAAVRRAFSGYRTDARQFEPTPERRSAAPRRRLLALAAGVPVTVTVIAVFIMHSLAAPPAAFAGWTAVPSAPDPALAVVVEHECRDALPDAAQMSDERYLEMFDEEQRRRVEAMAVPATLPLVAQDRRGEVTLAFFTDGHTYANCTMLGGDRGYAAVVTGWLNGQLDRPLRVVGGIRAEGSDDVAPMTSVIGQVQPHVARVVIDRSEGEPVAATVTDGYFLAWWPGTADIVRITAYDEAGEIVETN